MNSFIGKLTLALGVFSVLSGVFLDSLLSSLNIRLPDSSGFSWTLIAAMPVVLLLSSIWLDRQLARTALVIALQSFAQLLLFLAPWLWVIRHAVRP
jgi:hypothetical protein